MSNPRKFSPDALDRFARAYNATCDALGEAKGTPPAMDLMREALALRSILVANGRDPDADAPIACRAFALCDREATSLVPHPILGEYPSCDRCAEKLAR